MDFAESTQYLYSLGNEVSAMKLGLENIRKLLAALGDPQNNYPKVQIAGTNGKGSVCAFLDSICNTAGIRTGTFTSPHLITITERIRINGVDISEDDFARYATTVSETAESLLAKGELEYRPTFFEQITAIALVAFAAAKVEVAILETGLGGRLDATTAANAEIAAITRIDIDHQEYLGETIEEIAAEKAAIICQHSIAIIGEQKPEAMEVLLGRCREVGVIPSTECKASVWAVDMANNSAVTSFRTKRGLYDDPNLGLKGRHQIENARIAVMVAETLRFDFGLDLSAYNIVDGLENARHPGRLECQGKFLFDGAHNVAGANALRAYLDEFVRQPITLVFGAMKEKDVTQITKILFPKADNLILTRPNNERALTAQQIAEFAPEKYRERVVITETVADAIGKAKEIVHLDGIILVTGSLYLVGEVKGLLNNR